MISSPRRRWREAYSVAATILQLSHLCTCQLAVARSADTVRGGGTPWSRGGSVSIRQWPQPSGFVRVEGKKHIPSGASGGSVWDKAVSTACKVVTKSVGPQTSSAEPLR